MRIVWCTLQFLDYRIPVFEALSKLDDVELYLVFNGDINSNRILDKITTVLGEKAIPLYGEISLNTAKSESFANQGFRLPFQKNLISTIKKLKPDVMVSDGFFQWSYATLYMRATKDIPHVMCYERTLHTERNAQKIRTIYRKFVLKYIDAIACSGLLCKQYVRHLGFKKSITEGFMVADIDSFVNDFNKKNLQKQQSVKKNNETVNYLFVGRLIKLKGIIELIDAWRKFIETVDQVKLTIVGGGELEEYIHSQIENNGIASIDLVGRVEYDEVLKYYKKADIFILPTLEDNWSLVVPEAMAVGLPVMTTIYNGCYPELVKPENGWVFDALNPNDFLNKLMESYKARHKFSEMGEASKEIVKNYTPQTAAKSIYDTCKMAINSKNKKVEKNTT